MESSTPIEIISKRSEQEIQTIPGLTEHLKSREIPFINALARLSKEEHLGWEKIVPFPEHNTMLKTKQRPPRTRDTAFDRKFTGAGLCIYSSEALIEAMRTIAPTLKARLMNIRADTDAELDTTTKKTHPHTVVLITDPSRNTTVIDTSFRQVKHDGPMIIDTPEDQLPARYSVKEINPEFYSDQAVNAHLQLLNNAVHFRRVVSSLI